MCRERAEQSSSMRLTASAPSFRRLRLVAAVQRSRLALAAGMAAVRDGHGVSVPEIDILGIETRAPWPPGRTRLRSRRATTTTSGLRESTCHVSPAKDRPGTQVSEVTRREASGAPSRRRMCNCIVVAGTRAEPGLDCTRTDVTTLARTSERMNERMNWQ